MRSVWSSAGPEANMMFQNTYRRPAWNSSHEYGRSETSLCWFQSLLAPEDAVLKQVPYRFTSPDFGARNWSGEGRLACIRWPSPYRKAKQQRPSTQDRYSPHFFTSLSLSLFPCFLESFLPLVSSQSGTRRPILLLIDNSTFLSSLFALCLTHSDAWIASFSFHEYIGVPRLLDYCNGFTTNDFHDHCHTCPFLTTYRSCQKRQDPPCHTLLHRRPLLTLNLTPHHLKGMPPSGPHLMMRYFYVPVHRASTGSQLPVGTFPTRRQMPAVNDTSD